MTASTQLVMVIGIVSLIPMESISASEVKYRILDLGTLGSAGSLSQAVNDLGHVVGWSGLNESVAPRPFFYDGSMIDLASGEHQKGRALGINDLGQVVGDAETITSESLLAYRAFVSQNGNMTFLGSLGGPSSQAAGINDNGQIVGWSETVPPAHGAHAL